MASQTPPSIRHRIQEITVQPTTSERPTKLEVLIDGQCIHRLSPVKPGQALRWDMQTYPCDVHSGSAIGLRLIEIHYVSPDREVLVEYTLSEAANQTSIAKDAGAFPSGLSAFGLGSKRSNATSSSQSLRVTVKLVDLSQIANGYSATFDRATKMAEGTQGPLDKIGGSRDVLKTILQFGAVVAELHPTAKLVVGLCTKAWEYLEKMQKQHEDLQRLLDELAQIQPFVNAVKDRAKEPALEHVILRLLHLIEDTSNYIINSMHQTSTGRIIHGFSETRDPHRIGELLEKFGDLKEHFDRGVGVETLGVSTQALDVGERVLNQVLSSEQRALINRLEPAALSLSMPPPCHEGTRVQAIADICAWHADESSPQKLLWLYGQAGMGKSSIASSVCQAFHDAGTLGAHFFFRRDDPHLRSPEHMLNVIVHRLAFRYELYGRAVAGAIESYTGLLDMPLGQRYVHLVERPLQSLGSTAGSPPARFAIVVDALDECEKTDSRRPLFSYLREMSQLVPWIKIVITSRPDEDIKVAFNNNTDPYVASRDIASHDASSDIHKYIQTQMNIIADLNQLQWTQDIILELSTRAAGLFIWAKTACRFIDQGLDKEGCLEQILTGTQSMGDASPLDLLYTTAIEQAVGNGGPSNVRVFRECIGAIVATGSRTPLPVTGLEMLLSGYVNRGVFPVVIRKLSSVLYEDASQGGMVRVYHPSFADFILDPSRSGTFYADLDEQNTTLTECSLRTMMQELRFNICGLETSHVLNRDVADLETRVQTAIEPHLAYSCVHWSSHLTNTAKGNLRDQLGEFLHGPQLVYWIEALSLLGQINTALSGLLGLVDWASEAMEDHSSYANDAYRFILTFYDTISQSTPHLYISALPFAPTSSKLAQRMRKHFPNTFMTPASTDEGWPTCLQSITHNDTVASIAYSADGRLIVTGCQDDTVRMWDCETGTALSDPLTSPEVWDVALSSDGQRVASVSRNGEIRIWDLRTSALVVGPFECRMSSLDSLTFSSDGSKLFTIGLDFRVIFFQDGRDILVWDTNTGAQLSTLSLTYEETVTSTTVSPDDKLVAHGYLSGAVKIWNITSGKLLAESSVGHLDGVLCVAFSPSSQMIATGSSDKTVRIWEVSTGRELGQPLTGHSGSVWSVAFSPDGRYVVSGSSDKTVRVWDVETGMPACSPLVGHTGQIQSLAFCSNGRRVVSTSFDKTVLIWDVALGLAATKSRVGHTNIVTSVAFSSDGRYLVSGSRDGTIQVWDTQSGDKAYPPLISSFDTILLVAFILSSLHVVSLTGGKTVQVHDAETGILLSSFALSGLESISAVAISPDGQHIASTSSYSQVGLWDTRTGLALYSLAAGFPDWKAHITYSPNGRFLARGSSDGTLCIWEAENCTAAGMHLVDGRHSIWCISFSPNSLHVAFGCDDGRIRVWDIENDAIACEPLQALAQSIVFTLDGRYIISGSDDGAVRIWDTETGTAVGEPLRGHLDRVNSIALCSDGRRIATGSSDNTVRIWDLENPRIHDQLVIEELFEAPLKRSISTSVLAHYANESGWVTSSSGALLLWLPKQRQRLDDSIVQISVAPTPNHITLDLSKFVHGKSWASVARG